MNDFQKSGENFRKILRSYFNDMEFAAKTLDISRSTLYKYFKEERLDDVFLLSVALKLDLDKSVFGFPSDSKKTTSELEKKIERLEANQETILNELKALRKELNK